MRPMPPRRYRPVRPANTCARAMSLAPKPSKSSNKWRPDGGVRGSVVAPSRMRRSGNRARWSMALSSPQLHEDAPAGELFVTAAGPPVFNHDLRGSARGRRICSLIRCVDLQLCGKSPLVCGPLLHRGPRRRPGWGTVQNSRRSGPEQHRNHHQVSGAELAVKPGRVAQPISQQGSDGRVCGP